MHGQQRLGLGGLLANSMQVVKTSTTWKNLVISCADAKIFSTPSRVFDEQEQNAFRERMFWISFACSDDTTSNPRSSKLSIVPTSCNMSILVPTSKVRTWEWAHSRTCWAYCERDYGIGWSDELLNKLRQFGRETKTTGRSGKMQKWQHHSLQTHHAISQELDRDQGCQVQSN